MSTTRGVQLEQVLSSEELKMNRREMKNRQRIAKSRQRREDWVYTILNNEEFA
jgi:hypothetical protein